MKTMIFFFIGFMLTATAISAQGQKQDRDQIRLQDHLMLKDGILYQIKDQDQIRLQDRIRLHDGTMVNPDGTYQSKDRKQQRLKDGQCLDMDGKRYKSQDQFRDKMNRRVQAMKYEHFLMQNGQMYHIRNQEMVRMQDKVQLKNGTVVHPDGKIQIQGRKQLQLRDGECLNMDGDRFKSQDRMRDRIEQQDRDRINRGSGQDRMGPGNQGKRGGRG